MTPSSGITSFSLPYLCCLVVVFVVVAVVVFVVVVATVGDPHRGTEETTVLQVLAQAIAVVG